MEGYVAIKIPRTPPGPRMNRLQVCRFQRSELSRVVLFIGITRSNNSSQLFIFPTLSHLALLVARFQPCINIRTLP